MLSKAGVHRAMFFRRKTVTLDQASQSVSAAHYDLDGALAFCLSLIDCLGHVHRQSKLHHEICLSNCWMREDGSLELRDDDRMPLGYFSPEQTGRMNRGVDYRSDYYSLGVVFYELFSGQLPFESDHVMELVHSHIAKQPVQPLKINPEIPQMLSNVVMKLLAKNAEDRYQSLSGLRADMLRCQQALFETGIIAAFALGQHDASDRLQISQKLYGREKQVTQLIDAFHRVATGGAELLFVTGYSGIGKSSLVNEIHKPVVVKRGYFISGKFDQHKRNIPYYGIGQAFRELMRQILMESESRIAEWKSKILEAVGTNGQIMIEAMPALEFIIGKQAAPIPLGPAESQNRFNYVVQNFVSVFARPEHPLVIFLDDLQWADDASVKLIHFFMTSLDRPSLLMIGSYRDNEVEAGDSLMQTIAVIRKRAPVSTIEVTPLSEENVAALVADTLNVSLDAVTSLAHLIYNKTLGNPFFVGQFIKSLHNEQLLKFVDGAWCWNIQQIEAMAITDNVVDLLTKELGRLPQATQYLLTLAACFGNGFDLNTLATVGGKARNEARELLEPALRAGLVMSPEHTLAASGNTLFLYRFLHDRVQQAAYGGIPENEKKAVHLQIGRLLLGSIPVDQRDDRLFGIVQQLNEGRDLLTDHKEKFELAELNLLAARKSKSTIAYQTVLKHASIGMALLESVDGTTSPLYFALQLEKMEASFLSHQFSDVDKIGESILAHAQDDLQRARILDVLLQSYLYQDRQVDALPLALKTLHMLGVKIPEKLSKLQLIVRMMRLKKLVGTRSTDDYLNLPRQQDPVEILKQQVLGRAISACYVANPGIFPILTMEQLRINLKSGYATPFLPNGLLGCAMVQIQGFGAIQVGYELGALALALTKNKQASRDRNTNSVRDIFAVFGAIFHWKHHLSSTIAPLFENYQAGLQIGEFEYALYSLHASLRAELISGCKLPQLLEKLQMALSKAINLKQKTASDAIRINIGFVSTLMGVSVDEEGNSAGIATKNMSRLSLMHWNLFEAVRAYLFNDFAVALEYIEQSEKYLGSASCMASLPVYYLFHSLCLLACYQKMDRRQRRFALVKVGKLQQKMQGWAQHAPMNILHKWQLVEAERYRALAMTEQAAHYFDLAIKGAHDHGYVNDEALANELAGRFYLWSGKDMVARIYLEESHAKYVTWGASAKVRHLENMYPELLSRAMAIAHREAVLESASAEQRLDIETIIKASQTLSGEIQLDQLLEKLMRLLVENSGAQKGALLLQRNGVLMIQARAQDDTIEVRQESPAEESADLSLAIINYVKHTREKLILGNVEGDSQFEGDPYVQRAHPKSVLCLPLKKKNELVGILYLENNLAYDAFTSEHTELLEILSTQIAISLENAELYNELEQKIEARTYALSQKNEELSKTLNSLRQMQKQLVESEKLASLGQLVAGVAHEINTPVGVAVTGASTLLEDTEKLLSSYRDGSMKRSDLESYVGTASTISKLLLSNMERAATLIQSFKDVAIDQTSDERRRFGLKSYIEEVLLNLNPMLRKAERKVMVDCAQEIEVDTYPGALSQILTNLVMNALLHAFEDGKPGSMAIVASESISSTIVLRFSDDGLGIPAENLNKIFDPFFTTRRGRGGSGLGLNIVHNLVTVTLQGQISVESQVNEGTTFTLNFPRSPIKKLPAGGAA